MRFIGTKLAGAFIVETVFSRLGEVVLRALADLDTARPVVGQQPLAKTLRAIGVHALADQ